MGVQRVLPFAGSPEGRTLWWLPQGAVEKKKFKKKKKSYQIMINGMLIRNSFVFRDRVVRL